ncbi:MAG: hypothetical protein IKW30_12720 [Lachnospiraceae bacterium]|nr:hypothetical protein [Lachnospiraceae bacterium]
MRKHVKKQLTEILESLLMLHSELLGKNTLDVMDSLQDSQQAAVVVGETLEKQVLTKQPVSLLEQYCEELFLISQEEYVLETRVRVLDEFIIQVKNFVENISATYQIAFFPYKAEMWDSLESIWQEANRDECCEAVVVPIPYYRYEGKTKETVVCYDGDKFPSHVPIVSYLNYSLENEKPDVAYIHNPYDNRNLVTSVHPYFYSAELKKHVGKLVYVPYYVTTGAIAQDHKLLSAYFHMDYMVAQSPMFKEGCKDMFYYDKVVALGSPKLDKAIRMCQQGKEVWIPEEWKATLQGKKSLMLNTSLNCFLQQGAQYLQKLYVLFQWVKEHKEVAIVWRPHPLLEATMHSLRPQLLEKYQILKAYFEQEKIGIFDNTPEIERTIAVVDGYIGEEGTSVINLFGAVGKPIFLMNNFIYRELDELWKRKVRIADMEFVNEKWYMVSSSYNGLFSVNGERTNAKSVEWNDICFEGRDEGAPYWNTSHSSLASVENQIHMIPEIAWQSVSYDCKRQEFFRPYGPKEYVENKKLLRFKDMVSYEESRFFLPNKNEAIWEYGSITKQWTAYTKCLEDWRQQIPKEKYMYLWDVCGFVQDENMLYMVSCYTNRILCFNMRSKEHKIYSVGEQEYTYSAITGSNGVFWLAESASGNIIKWDSRSNQEWEIRMPSELGLYVRYDGLRMVHNRLFDMGDWIISTPAFANGMVKVDKLTGNVSLCAKELWVDANLPCNDYHPSYYMVSGFAKQIDKNTLWIQRTFDDVLIELKVDSEEYNIQYPMLSETSMEKMLENEDGFERINRGYSAFARRESRVFSMEGFMDDFVSGRLEHVRERQLTELSDIAVNLDGTCGQKVHEFMMNVLKKES